MRSTYLSIILMLSILSIFSSCAPKSIVRISLDKNEKSYWHKGLAIGQQETDSIICEVVFSHVEKDFMFFDVSVENKGDQNLIADPSGFRIFDIRGQLIMAINPEHHILKQEIKASRREASNKTAALIAGAAVVTGAVLAASSADGGGSGGSGEEEDVTESNIYIANIISETDIDGASNFGLSPVLSLPIAYIPPSKSIHFWQEYTLRKTTLHKDQAIRGLVAFPRNDALSSLQFIIPLDHSEMSFLFHNKVYKP